MAGERAVKVAVVGGGCAGIAAAFELSRPEHRDRFEVTVYQLGWRLGGKGASGRGPSGRIEEHGLHVWLGFYENAFRLLRECYAELAGTPGGSPFGDWRDAFITEHNIGLSARTDPEKWHNWSACFPPLPGLPGDPMTTSELVSIPRYVARAIDMLRTLIESIDSRRQDGGPVPQPAAPTSRGLDAAAASTDPRRLAAAVADLTSGAFAATSTVLIEALAVLQAGLRMLPAPLTNPLTDLSEWIAGQVRRLLETTIADEPYFQHVWEVMDLVVASLVGIFRDGLLTDPHGFDAIDDLEWRDWLRRNGASERALNSAFLRGLYDLSMAYEDGDPQRPRLAAGTSLRCTLRMFFSYRGALYWRMAAGMGDIVFAPFYEVLRRRGVRFEFFHRLTNVRLAAPDELAPGESPYVSALEFDVQAKVKGGGAYQPLVEIRGRPCWPSGADLSQLEDGDRLQADGVDFECHWDRRNVGRRTLAVTTDFDFVVLGVSIGALPEVCREILARDPRWRRMVQEVKTIESEAFQIWLDRSLEDLGWRGPHFIGSAFTKPFDTWCDMAHTVPLENWAEPPRTALYFCGALHAAPAEVALAQKEDYPRRRQDDVREHALEYLSRTARLLWPGAYDAAGEFRWELLRDAGGSDQAGKPASPAGPERFETQYWRANVNPSDRYVLALPGSSKHRISPLDNTYDNLTIAGDWTACGLNEGCVEAAVISGRLAAHALAGAPRLEEIVGYDHP